MRKPGVPWVCTIDEMMEDIQEELLEVRAALVAPWQ